jgi:hypothetical protein
MSEIENNFGKWVKKAQSWAVADNNSAVGRYRADVPKQMREK